MIRLEVRAIVSGLVLLGCAPSQPQFVEPAWGSAPPPYPSEVIEITLDTRVCPPTGPGCADHHLLLQRDGHARWEYGRRGHLDSVFVGEIDSSAFVHLATALRERHFFGRETSGGHEPLAVTSYVASAASLCRRATSSYVVREGSTDTLPIPNIILSTASQVVWSRCCGDRLIPIPR